MVFALMKKVLSFLVVMKVYPTEKLHLKFNTKSEIRYLAIYIYKKNQEKPRRVEGS